MTTARARRSSRSRRTQPRSAPAAGTVTARVAGDGDDRLSAEAGRFLDASTVWLAGGAGDDDRLRGGSALRRPDRIYSGRLICGEGVDIVHSARRNRIAAGCEKIARLRR